MPCLDGFRLSVCLSDQLELLIGIPGRLLLRPETVVLVNVGRFPGVADPYVPDGAGGMVAAAILDILGEGSLLWLVFVLFVCAFHQKKTELLKRGWLRRKKETYVKDKNGKLGLLATKLLTGNLDVLLQLLDGVLERRAGVVDLVDNEDALADQVAHLAEGAEVEPLGARDLGSRLLDHLVVAGGEALVEGEADGLDGDVGAAGLLEERAEDARGDVATTADGDHELGLDGLEKLGSSFLAKLVYLLLWVVSGFSVLRNHVCYLGRYIDGDC